MYYNCKSEQYRFGSKNKWECIAAKLVEQQIIQNFKLYCFIRIFQYDK